MMITEEIHIKMLQAKYHLIFAKKDIKVNPDKSERLLSEALEFIKEGLILSQAQIENNKLQKKLSENQSVESDSCKCVICEETLKKDYTCPNPNCPEYGC